MTTETESGTDHYGAEYKRSKRDFRFRFLRDENCVCDVCHGTGATVEFEYVKRNYESKKQNGKICKTLQEHNKSLWICPLCIANMNEQWEKTAKMKESCANCKHNRPIEHWEYDKVKTGAWKHKLNGYACTAFDEAVVWMTGCDVEKGMCELWGERGEQE